MTAPVAENCPAMVTMHCLVNYSTSSRLVGVILLATMSTQSRIWCISSFSLRVHL